LERQLELGGDALPPWFGLRMLLGGAAAPGKARQFRGGQRQKLLAGDLAEQARAGLYGGQIAVARHHLHNIVIGEVNVKVRNFAGDGGYVLNVTNFSKGKTIEGKTIKKFSNCLSLF
jgi:hypothetical protein